MVEYKWGYFLNMIMLGNQLTFDKWDIYIDIMHHSLAWNDWGKNIGFVSCANYYFTPQFNIFVKGMYEQNKSDVTLGSSVAIDHQLAAGHTSARYGLGFEWFPSKEKNVRLHIYACRMTDSYDRTETITPTESPEATAPTTVTTRVTDACWNFNIGATWTIDDFQLFKR